MLKENVDAVWEMHRRRPSARQLASQVLRTKGFPGVLTGRKTRFSCRHRPVHRLRCPQYTYPGYEDSQWRGLHRQQQEEMDHQPQERTIPGASGRVVCCSIAIHQGSCVWRIERRLDE